MSLAGQATGEPKEFKPQNFVQLDRQGYVLKPEIKKKSDVYPDMLLGEHPAANIGNLFSPVRGEVTEVTERFINIKLKPSADEDQTVPSADISALAGDELALALKNLGIDTCDLCQNQETLIINALNPEPGIQWADAILAHTATLLAGLDVCRRFAKAKNIIMALPKGTSAAYEGVEFAYITPEYPNSLEPVLIKAVIGKNRTDKVGVIGLHTLWGLGRVALTGRPLTETILTVSCQTRAGNYIVAAGTPISEILAYAGIMLEPGDSVVIGGPLRGQAIAWPEQGLNRHATGIFVVGVRSVPPLQGDGECCYCGACDLICPARISPGMLSRYAEFGKYDQCEKNYANACMECGLCGYVCMSRRPVLQYIRLAKHHLKLAANTLGVL